MFQTKVVEFLNKIYWSIYWSSIWSWHR